MIRTEFDRELADTIYREVRFNIDPEQFGDKVLKSATAHTWGWHDEDQQARAYAQEVADEAQQEVEVAAYGFWGHDCFEYIETFKVQPRA